LRCEELQPIQCIPALYMHLCNSVVIVVVILRNTINIIERPAVRRLSTAQLSRVTHLVPTRCIFAAGDTSIPPVNHDWRINPLSITKAESKDQIRSNRTSGKVVSRVFPSKCSYLTRWNSQYLALSMKFFPRPSHHC
jgi:hypothetical protein